VATLLAVQRSAGNAAVGRLLARQVDTPVQEPAAPGGWETMPGTPFASPAGRAEAEIHPNDVTQGSLGDCWLAAAMAAVARARPEVIRSLIHDRGDGTYDVSLYIAEGGGFAESPQTVRVSSSFPAQSGRPAYARAGDTSAAGLRELWPMLIEKAYAAMLSGGYPSLSGDVSGSGRAGGLSALLGTSSAVTLVADRTDAQVLADISGALVDRRPIVCETPPAFGAPGAGAGVGIRSNHAYAPSAVTDDTIMLQDPNDHRPRSVPVATFRALFRAYMTVGVVAVHDPPPGGPVQLPSHAP